MRAGVVDHTFPHCPNQPRGSLLFSGQLRAGGCHDKSLTWRHSYTEPTAGDKISLRETLKFHTPLVLVGAEKPYCRPPYDSSQIRIEGPEITT